MGGDIGRPSNRPALVRSFGGPVHPAPPLEPWGDLLDMSSDEEDEIKDDGSQARIVMRYALQNATTGCCDQNLDNGS